MPLMLALMAVSAFAQNQMPPIPIDKDVRIGKLDNGLTYYIRYNNWPENRAEFYIAQRVGSIQEDENQRGKAQQAIDTRDFFVPEKSEYCSCSPSFSEKSDFGES